MLLIMIADLKFKLSLTSNASYIKFGNPTKSLIWSFEFDRLSMIFEYKKI